MKYNGFIDIAIGMSACSKKWMNEKIKWSDLISRLSEENRTSETSNQYHSANKKEKSKIKDVGGYFGGFLRGGKRNPKNVIYRQLITLDIDYADLDFWDIFTLQFNNSAFIHSTHSHTAKSPRYRLVMPLSREVTPDEYSAISRKIAGLLDIELFDSTTFQVNRLMFWPSVSSDADYYFKFQDGPWVDPDVILSYYVDWKDSSQWPTSVRNLQEVRNATTKQQDPENKKGIIGAFCRTFSITRCIDLFLKDVYEEFTEGRYTYKKGSTAGGLVLYDDKFAYSHHGSDPSSGILCNAFDLVRIHRFGHLDSGNQRDASKKLSFKQMEEFARSNKEVKKTIASENINGANYVFSEAIDDKYENEDEDLTWTEQLEVNTRGQYFSNSTNLNLIFENDPRLKGAFKFNSFDRKIYVCKNMPWRLIDENEPIRNVDYSGIRNYIESIYGIVGTQKIDDSLMLAVERSSYHPIREFLKSIIWDGKERVETLLIDYFGCEENIYSRESIKKMLVAAVSRVFDPGVKFDLVLTLVGDQGVGKSTLLYKLGKKWFSDTFITVHGKEAYEQLQGVWIIEMAELSGLRKAEVESVKHFISKQEDMFRPAYARSTEIFKRQCVFFATTNSDSFLRDSSGNRRFMPIDVNHSQATKDIFSMSEEDVDQIWAEAYQMFLKGEKLYLSTEANSIANLERKNHSVVDSRLGVIEEYIHTKVPKHWNKMDLYKRRDFLSSDIGEGSEKRKYICASMVWCECLGKNKEDLDSYKAREINDILRSISGVKKAKSTKLFPIYGRQRYYEIHD